MMKGRLLAGTVLALLAAASPSPARAAAVPTTWCGASAAPSQVDRLPDKVAGPQVQVLYAHPTNGPYRFPTMADQIASDWAAADAWWRAQDPSRTVRLDLYAFPGCRTQFGALDVADVTLPHDTAFYWGLNTRFDRLLADLTYVPYAFHKPFKKYVVYFDGGADRPEICGEADDESAGGYAFVFVQSCGMQFGNATMGAVTAVHELVHALGAVPFNAPHQCVPPTGHVCGTANQSDILYPFIGPSLDAMTLDIDHDDYYAHGGNWWDVQDSPFLSHLDQPQFTSRVEVAGLGKGSVASNEPGIACTATCAATWDASTTFALTATPADGSRFAGWSGACTGTDPCALTMDNAKTVVATFKPTVAHVLTVAETGHGLITSVPESISCPGACSAEFPAGAVVTMREVPAKGYRFAGWSGACKGHATACHVTMRVDQRVRAAFRKS